jgi:polyphosphate kinase 2 (PPK2 family)
LPKAIEDASMRSGGYLYDERMKRAEFEERLLALQIELVKLQKHNLKTGGRILCLYEGRDGSGKGSCIKAFNQHMNPRNTRTVAHQADRNRARTALLPALRRAPSDRR